jgi:hypothetical protein
VTPKCRYATIANALDPAFWGCEPP